MRRDNVGLALPSGCTAAPKTTITHLESADSTETVMFASGCGAIL
jgi:hypothetical protein